MSIVLDYMLFRLIWIARGRPSDRVQEGRFRACLMAEPDLVGACVAAMKAACASR